MGIKWNGLFSLLMEIKASLGTRLSVFSIPLENSWIPEAASHFVPTP